jgi:predicted amidohydrolase YtcJ
VFHDVEVEGRRLDVRIERGAVTHLGHDLPAADQHLDGAGGALLPGLHDHHLHLLALAAHLQSVDLSGLDEREALAALRTGRVTGGWLRATGYYEWSHGALDRDALDTIRPDVPMRVQHRSGALWILNSAALATVAAVLDDTADVERDTTGRPNGRLWRYDARLRPALPDTPPDLTAVGRTLARVGITSVTDATPDLDPVALSLLAAARERGALPQQVTLLGAADGAPLPPGMRSGPVKLLLRDHDLPSYDELTAMVAQAREQDRAVAVHCVTRHSLVLTLSVLETVGVRRGDRIEHAAVAPPELAAWMARLGVAVVTQPDFLRGRGREYVRDVEADDLPHLYPYASLLAAGVATCASSDAPYGGLDPWRIIASAANRPLGADENVPARIPLEGYLSPAGDPGGRPRRLRAGARADLVLLHAPLEECLRSPSAESVRSVWIRGVVDPCG